MTARLESVAARRLAFVDALRGLAICGVLWHHLYAKRTPSGWGLRVLGDVPITLNALLSNGWLGVNLFFVLSGLVLYLPYAEGRRALVTRADLAAFYGRRARRLLPLYFVSVVLALVFMTPRASWKDVALLATFTFPFTRSSFFPAANWVLWSLGLEFWFSVLFPLLARAADRFGIRAVAAAAAALGLAVRTLSLGHPEFDLGNPYLNPMKDVVLGRLDDFAFGMLLAEVVLSRPRNSGVVALYSGVVFLWLGAALWDGVRLGVLGLGIEPVINDVVLLGCGGLVLGLASTTSGLLGRALLAWPVRMLGLMSYSIYVWHSLLRSRLLSPGFGAFDAAVYFLWLLTLSALSYRTIEFGRIRRWRDLVPRRIAQPAAPTAEADLRRTGS